MKIWPRAFTQDAVRDVPRRWLDELASWQLAGVGRNHNQGEKSGESRKWKGTMDLIVSGRRNGADAETGTRKREPVEMSR